MIDIHHTRLGHSVNTSYIKYNCINAISKYAKLAQDSGRIPLHPSLPLLWTTGLVSTRPFQRALFEAIYSKIWGDMMLQSFTNLAIFALGALIACMPNNLRNVKCKLAYTPRHVNPLPFQDRASTTATTSLGRPIHTSVAADRVFGAGPHNLNTHT